MGESEEAKTMKCEYCGKERDFPFLAVQEITRGRGKMERHFCNYICLDKFLHEKLKIKSQVVRL